MAEDKVDYSKEENLRSPIQSIRKKCLECCCNSSNEIKRCNIVTCPLWPYRDGKRPYAKPVECKICKKAFKRITSFHLKGHDITLADYNELFPSEGVQDE
jgi:hypothetical protein